MLISTIVLAVTGVSGAGAAGGGSKGFLQKQLKRLGNFLKYLKGKSGAAFPGTLGSIVSFFLRTAARVLEFVGKQLYLAFSGAVALVVIYIEKTKIS